jgi:hypothetical protein
MNGAAQRMTRADDGLSGEGNKLRLSDARADAALCARLRRAAPTLAGQLPPGGLMDAPRPLDMRSHCVFVLAGADRNAAPGENAFTITVLVSDPAPAHSLAPETLIQLFGLTPAEARLTAA